MPPEIIDQSYRGETRNPLADRLAEKLEQFADYGPEKAREYFRSLGVIETDRKRRRVWDQFAPQEQAVLMASAGVHRYSVPELNTWDNLNPTEQTKVWQAIQRAAAWGDRIRAAID